MYHWLAMGKSLDLVGKLEMRAKRWLLKKAEKCQETVNELTLQHDFRFLIEYAVQNKAERYFAQPH